MIPLKCKINSCFLIQLLLILVLLLLLFCIIIKLYFQAHMQVTTKAQRTHSIAVDEHGHNSSMVYCFNMQQYAILGLKSIQFVGNLLS